MKLRSILIGVSLAGVGLALTNTVDAWDDDVKTTETQPEISPDQQAIKQTAEAFVAAFNKGDAKAVAALWTENGEMSVDGQTTTTGRAEIQSSYTEFFKTNSGVQISVHIDSMRNLGPTMIIEKGVSEIMNDDTDNVVDTYTLVHVKQNEKWLIATADVQQTTVDRFDWKAEIDFMAGKWKAEDGDWRVESEAEWVADGNFLKRSFASYEGTEKKSSGVQIIGWDPAQESVTSWTFGSDGGHGRGWWVLDGDQWEIAAEGVTSGGEVLTATNVITFVDPDTFRWQSTGRSIQGYALEATDSIRVSRIKSDQ